MTPKEKAQLIFNAAQLEEAEVYAKRGDDRIYLQTALVIDGRTVGISRNGNGFEAADVTDDDVYQVTPSLLYQGSTIKAAE